MRTPLRPTVLAGAVGLVALGLTTRFVTPSAPGGLAEAAQITIGDADTTVRSPGDCTDDIGGGVMLDGAGSGLCVGTGPTPTGRTAVWLVVDGEPTINFAIDDCAIESADTTMQLIGSPHRGGMAVLAALSPRAAYVSIPVEGAGTTVAETFTVDGYEGIRFVATTLGGNEWGHMTQLDADRVPLTWDANTPAAPECKP